jgi:hypothetical protein
MNLPYGAGRPAPLHLFPYGTAQSHEKKDSNWFSSVGIRMKAETSRNASWLAPIASGGLRHVR